MKIFGYSLVVILLFLMTADLARFITQPFSEEVPDFASYPAGSERKAVFFEYFEMIIQEEIRVTLAQRDYISAMFTSRHELSNKDEQRVTTIAKDYEIEQFDADDSQHWQLLLRRVDIVPASLALAQAANESAWGTSRFAREANNFFGHWCFEKGCGLVPKNRNAGANHEVADFDSPRESVQKYMRNLNTHPAYLHLRKIRERLRNQNKPITSHALLPALQKYSERGDAYIQELEEMINYNKLTKYDVSVAQLQHAD